MWVVLMFLCLPAGTVRRTVGLTIAASAGRRIVASGILPAGLRLGLHTVAPDDQKQANYGCAQKACHGRSQIEVNLSRPEANEEEHRESQKKRDCGRAFHVIYSKTD